MIKRTLSCVAAVLFAVPTFAADLGRYIVVTNRPARQITRLVPMQDSVADRDVILYESINGYAADLSADEVAALRQSPDVRYVEPVKERHAFEIDAPVASSETRNITGQTVPYGIDLVHARDVWPVAKGATINVVVTDTGIDLAHEDLKNVYAGGYDFVQKDDTPQDEAGHGTHVAGTIAAADNNVGVVGVAPNVKIWSARVLNAKGSGTTADVIAAIDWAISKKRALGGNWVMNLSLGSSDASTAEAAAFKRAVNEGILVVAASGNESTATLPAPVAYPAAYEGVVAVGAVDSKKAIADFSNQGPEVALVGPGVSVLSSLPTGSGEIAYVTMGSSVVSAGTLTGSPKGTLTGDVVDCKLGKVGDFPSSVRGKIALIQRGDIRFSEKTRNAKSAGAAAVIIYNNQDSALNWTLVNDDEPDAATFAWPLTVGVTQEDGAKLVAAIGSPFTITYRSDDYGTLSGTSMATPHVAGTAALVWSVAPNADAAAVKLALTQTASDLGAAGKDNVYGAGLVDALAAAKQLNPAAFANPSTPAPTPRSGRKVLIRGR